MPAPSLQRSAYALAALLRDLQALKSVGAGEVQVEVRGQRYEVQAVDRAPENNGTVILRCAPEGDG